MLGRCFLSGWSFNLAELALMRSQASQIWVLKGGWGGELEVIESERDGRFSSRRRATHALMRLQEVNHEA